MLFAIRECRGDHLPSSVDDFVRYVCRYGEPAEAVALDVPTVFEEQGELLKTVRSLAELGEGWAERVSTSRFPPGADKPVASQTHWRESQHDPQRGWLGVDPLVGWKLYLKKHLGSAQPTGQRHLDRLSMPPI